MSARENVIDAVDRFQATHSREPFVDKHAAAAFLGFSVSTVEKLVARRVLPSRRIGGKRMFRLSWLEAWTEEQDAG